MADWPVFSDSSFGTFEAALYTCKDEQPMSQSRYLVTCAGDGKWVSPWFWRILDIRPNSMARNRTNKVQEESHALPALKMLPAAFLYKQIAHQ